MQLYNYNLLKSRVININMCLLTVHNMLKEKYLKYICIFIYIFLDKNTVINPAY